jgi:hypothetical protein
MSAGGTDPDVIEKAESFLYECVVLLGRLVNMTVLWTQQSTPGGSPGAGPHERHIAPAWVSHSLELCRLLEGYSRVLAGSVDDDDFVEYLASTLFHCLCSPAGF